MPHQPIVTPFYKKAQNNFINTQVQQIQKGAEKYPEPFNPHSWSADALLEHAMQEAVDLVHYLTGLHEKIQANEQEIRRLNDIIKDKDRNISTLIESQRPSQTRKPKSLTFEELNRFAQRQHIIDQSPRDPLQPWRPYNETKPPYADLDD